MLLTDANPAQYQMHHRQNAALGYRADIDGLRAVAVVPVLLFHAGVGLFSGGYVGVDIFFVISGYLITGIIASEIERHRFSLLKFYERRVRRIAPCLLAMCMAILVAGYILYLPTDFVSVAQNVVAALAFVANVALSLQAGYFAAPAEANPLLHTWSLAVEEQYYLFFPIFLMITYRHARHLVVPLLWAITLLSLAISIAGVFVNPVFTFYLAPTRAWELCVGSLLALGALPSVTSPRMRDGLAAAGLAMIIGSILFYSEATPFPGAAALLPVVGTALLIHCGQETRTAACLAHRLPVFIGLISYSLYLWHWPIIVFTKYALNRDLLPAETTAVVIASLVVATFSWRFIEQPFRNRQRFSARSVVLLAAAGAGIVLAASTAVLAKAGLPSRFSGDVLALAAGRDDFSPERERCHRGDGFDPPIRQSCVYGAAVPPAFAVWGDSHGVELAFALGEVAGRNGASLLHLTYSACPPALGYAQSAQGGCSEFNERAFRYLRASPTVDTVILAANYDSSEFREDPSYRVGIERSVNGLVEAGKRVVLVGPTPMHPFRVPKALAQHAATANGELLTGPPTAAFLARNAAAFEFLKGISGARIVHVYPHELLCESRCLYSVGARPLYFDNHHLSMTGARLIAPMFAPLFRGPAGEHAGQ